MSHFGSTLKTSTHHPKGNEMKAWNLKKGDMFRLHPARKAHRVDSIQHLCRGGEGEGAARPLRVELATVVEGSSQRVFRALDADQEIFPV
jgi:hypothetical protein